MRARSRASSASGRRTYSRRRRAAPRGHAPPPLRRDPRSHPPARAPAEPSVRRCQARRRSCAGSAPLLRRQTGRAARSRRPTTAASVASGEATAGASMHASRPSAPASNSDVNTSPRAASIQGASSGRSAASASARTACAIASSAEMPTTGRPCAKARPWMVAIPMRRPVSARPRGYGVQRHVAERHAADAQQIEDLARQPARMRHVGAATCSPRSAPARRRATLPACVLVSSARMVTSGPL